MDLTAKPAIEICEQDHIDDYAAEAREFFHHILGKDFDACLVTDESSLSDFSFSGAPDGVIPEQGTLQECYRAWDNWVLSAISRRYGIEDIKTRIRLLTLFDRIRRDRSRLLN